MSLLQKLSTPTTETDNIPSPLTNLDESPTPGYHYSIEMGQQTVALFQSVTGISFSRKVDPLTEGGLNNYVWEFPGHISFTHITFTVGLTSSQFFWKWMNAGSLDGYAIKKDFTLVQRRPNPTPPPATPDPNHPYEAFPELKRWNFFRAFPVSWKISDPGVENQNIVIETLELSYEYFELGT